MFQKASLLVGALALTATVAACGSDTTDGPGSSGGAQGAKLAYFVPLQNGFTQASLDGAKAAAEKRGATIESVFTANGDMGLQINQIKDAITSGKYDGFLIHPFAPQVMPAIKQAIDADIPVGVVEGSLNAEDILGRLAPEGASVTTTELLSDRVQGLVEMTKSTCGADPCKVGFIMGLKQNPSSIGVLEGFEAGIEDATNIEVVAVGEGMYQTATARTAAADMLSAHRDLNLIVTDDDSMTIGAELAARDAGMNDLGYVSVGANTAGCEAVEAGRWVGTTNAVPRLAGELGADGVLNTLDDPNVIDQVFSPLEESGLGVASLSGATDCPAQWQ